jgi:hypothetical protein
MNKSDLKDLIKTTIEEILQEKEINVTDKKDIPKDLEDDDIINISKDIKKFINKDKTQSDKLKNIGDRFKSKPVKLKDI